MREPNVRLFDNQGRAIDTLAVGGNITTADRAVIVAAALQALIGAGPNIGLLKAETHADAKSPTSYGLDVVAFPYGYNGSTYDIWRANTKETLLASSARTTTTSSPDQTNYNARGVIITLDVTAIVDTPSITLAVEAKDPASGKYEKLLDAAAVTAVGTHSYIVYPGAGAAGDDIVEVSGYPLPRTWRVTVTHADADSITYSVGAMYIL